MASVQSIGTNPGMVYRICKEYGIKTRHMLRKEKENDAVARFNVFCLCRSEIWTTM